MKNSKTIFPIDLINCNCQKLVSLDISLIKLSCKDKIITPKTNIISDENGLSLTCGLKNSNLTILNLSRIKKRISCISYLFHLCNDLQLHAFLF